MPLLLAALLTAFFLWLAENIGTATGTWLYPSSSGWRPVSLQKLGSWCLLLVVSFVLVTMVHRPRPLHAAAARRDSPGEAQPPAAVDRASGQGSAA